MAEQPAIGRLRKAAKAAKAAKALRGEARKAVISQFVLSIPAALW